MPRDYKEPVTSRKRPVPGWVWLLTGLLIGLFASGLLWLKDRGGDGREVLREAKRELARTRRQIEQARPKSPPEVAPRPRYEFYTLLPELEVVVPEEEYEAPAAPQARREAAPNRQPGAGGVRYLLQAGSFRSADEADRLRARLALLGVEASIQRVVVNGDTWHRVRIGPFTSMDELRTVRRRLANHHIQTLVTREAG